MKSLTIAGGIGKDAVTRTTQQGDKVTGFSVGVTEGFGDSKRTLWFDCSLWGSRGEKLAQYLTKGARVVVSGDMSTREHDGKTYLTLRAAEVTLMGGNDRRDDGQSNTARAADRAQRPTGGAPAGAYMDDEIPFAPEWR
ncbi:single-stranded DNA-binding protein [Rhodobacter sp. HX-7-19]|uniref:Single-stranded DNA-binding protein n=1 Tax=Paragemmobacter kunshanensis TaxID=2583234 RepID=A0A6M1U8D9_9RHOB|nr:single-stranded DNA-binding protein [Rhodobacter kunshanensis]NGQ91483.1 single-stranded DNA-binding protein [Rhodobacter kunshanensis]